MRVFVIAALAAACVPKSRLVAAETRLSALEKEPVSDQGDAEPRATKGVLSSWPDVQRHMRESYKLQDDEPYAISLVWGYDDGRSQLIWVRSYSAYDREMIEISSFVAREGQLDANVAVERNMKLALGTLARREDLYRVVYNTPLQGLLEDNFTLYLERLAISADELETEFTDADDY